MRGESKIVGEDWDGNKIAQRFGMCSARIAKDSSGFIASNPALIVCRLHAEAVAGPSERYSPRECSSLR